MDYRTERYDWQEIFTADLGFLHFPTTLQFIGSANSIQAPFGKQLYTFRKKRPLQLQAFCGGFWEMWNYYSLASGNTASPLFTSFKFLKCRL